MENDYSREVYEEDRLPMFHRTIKLPHGLWDKVKERGNQEQKALRWIVDDALDAELLPLVTLAFQVVFQTVCVPFGICRGHEKIGSGTVMSTPPRPPKYRVNI